MKLHTQNLVLRDFAECDRAPFIEMTQDPKYQRFYSETESSVDHNSRLVSQFIESAKVQPRTVFQLAVVESRSQKLIGTCGLRLEAGSKASIGCALDRVYQGKGLAFEAMHTMMALGFEELRLQTLYAETLAANKAALRLCKQLGMNKEIRVPEAYYFKNYWWDRVVLSTTRSDWQGSCEGRPIDAALSEHNYR